MVDQHAPQHLSLSIVATWRASLLLKTPALKAVSTHSTHWGFDDLFSTDVAIPVRFMVQDNTPALGSLQGYKTSVGYIRLHINVDNRAFHIYDGR